LIQQVSIDIATVTIILFIEVMMMMATVAKRILGVAEQYGAVCYCCSNSRP
jgi:hypothetical protein